MKRLKLFIPLLLIFALSNISCSVYQTIVNISRLKFKIGVVNNLTFCGVNLSNKKSINDFSALEVLKLTASFTNGSMPASFILNINAVNPNNGTGGYPNTNATIVSFPWRLLLDNKETVTGNLASPVTIPGTGAETVIPIQITVDLYKFFREKDYQSILNLALNLSGKGGSSSSSIIIYAKPVVSSPLGDISYPQELKIINYEYTK
jgi:hypothetical protein